jgi:hypothetical protein
VIEAETESTDMMVEEAVAPETAAEPEVPGC